MPKQPEAKKPLPPKTRAPANPPSTSAVYLWALGAMGLAVVVHARAFGYGFIWDDPLVLQQLRSLRTLGDVFVLPDALPKFYYRPLIFLTFLFDRAMGGENPFLFHAVVILFHAVATLLVFLLARHLLGSASTVESGVAALLFAVHPIHVESVAWIAGRSDVLATVFVLAAVLCSTRTDKTWTAWAAGAAMLLGLLSKEVALAVLVLVPARDLLVERRLLSTRYVPLVVAAAVYLMLRYVGLGTVGTGLPSASTPPDHVRDLFAAIGWYGAKLLVPMNLTAYVPTVPESPAYIVAGAVAVLAIGGGAAWALMTRRGVPAFLLVWLVVTLAPSLGVIVRRSASAMLADRYLYLPSASAVVLVGWLLMQWRPTTAARWRAAVAVVGCVVLVWSVQSFQRTQVWGDPVVFWTDVVEKAPEAGMPYRERGNIYMDRGQLDEAERDYRAAAIYEKEVEGRVMNYNNYGNLYTRRNQLAAAETAYKAGLLLYQHPFLYSGLARVEVRRAELAQAEGNGKQAMAHVNQARQYLERAVTLNPSDYKSRVLLGQVLFNLGERDAARKQIEAALAIEPTGPVADTGRRFLTRMLQQP